MEMRTIVEINEDLCDGCGICVPSCAEGAIQMVDGKAKLVSDIFCDGLGACLGHCPQDAIKVIQREAEGFDEEAAIEHVKNLEKDKKVEPEHHHHAEGHVCPGSMTRQMTPVADQADNAVGSIQSQLATWPVQLHLLNPNAPYLNNADLLLTADCVPFAYADFHRDFLKDHVLAIGCPKLDNVQPYVDKLTHIFANSSLNSLTILKMQVPCCSGIVQIAQVALQQSGAKLPVRIVTVGIKGEIVEDFSN